VISYELYCQIQLYYKERGLSFAQIGRELNLDEETVAKWARQKTYCQHLRARRKSKLDPFKPIIQRWLEQHPYSAAQIFQRLRAEHAYTGGISILTDYVRRVRPVRAPAFLTLVFAPGECAQVDWGSVGSMAIGSSDYIANILQQRERFSPQPGPLHLTRRQDLLEVELEQPDLSVYEGSETSPSCPNHD